MDNSDTWAWTKPNFFRSEYVLTCNGGRVATIAFDAILGGVARVKGRQIDWTIERLGLNSTVSVRQSGSDVPIAVARPRFTGSYDVEFEGGFVSRFKSISAWRAQFGWVNAGGTPMIIYTARPSGPSHRTIAISDACTIDEPLLRILMIFGGVLMAMTQAEVIVPHAAFAAAAAGVW